MIETYLHTRVLAAPRQWRGVADGIIRDGLPSGQVYGVWRSQIGRPRDELTVLTLWPDAAGAEAEEALDAMPNIVACESDAMIPTLRPSSTEPPRRQGNYAFRWFELPERHWSEFQDLCTAAWPNFEASYDSQVIGLWRCQNEDPGRCRSLLLTRRPDLAMWERSKIPQGETEVEVRRQLSRRYDLCDDTVVYTTTLLSAEDRDDTVRWT
ncbi:MAG: hypothetical protein HOC72_14650 [Rhodospirillaceae bacterium]|nr:hypothetical protein [Rhodospirillaceae bacterium]